MYATPHTSVGVAIIYTFKEKLEIGIPLAIMSHFVLDFIDEKGLSEEERAYFDIAPSLSLMLMFWYFDIYWWFVLGSVLGNLFDLIDKKLYLSVFFPKKFKSTKYFHYQKQLIFPPTFVTKWLGWFLVLIYAIIFSINM